MRLRHLLAAAVISLSIACGDPAPPPVPRAAPVTATRPVPAPQQQTATPPATIDSAPPRTFGPFTIEGGRYTATATRFTSKESLPDTGTRSVEIRDARQRVVYAERVMSDSDIAEGSWNDVAVSPLEDASGRARALVLWKSSYPSAPNTGDEFSVLVARGEMVQRLFSLGHFGSVDSMATNPTPGSARLLPGDRIVSPRWMYFYEAKVPLHVAFDCAPASRRCLDIVLPDSIAGLARFAVRATPSATDSTATVEMFDAPLAAHGTVVAVPKGMMVEVLGGAGKVSLEWTGDVQQVNVTDDWLLVRVNARTGWISGDAAYRAVGLPEAG